MIIVIMAAEGLDGVASKLKGYVFCKIGTDLVGTVIGMFI
jgi:hypothetical protein